MNSSTVRLVAADMDGTLLNAAHELPPDFFHQFELMKARGISFAAASGRQYYNLRNRFASISNEMSFIAENGSYLVHKGKELFVQPMDREMARTVIKKARTIDGVDIVLCGKNCAYLETGNSPFMDHVRMYYDERKIVPDLLAVEGDEFLKIALYDLHGSEAHSLPHFIQFREELQVKVSGHIWLDMSDKLANKGTALKILQQKLGVTESETMVFGDYLNDLEMMQSAYYSYAMENAHADVKKVSRFQAGSNVTNGVGQVLKQLLGSK